MPDMNSNGKTLPPFMQGSPFEKFFREYGFNDMPKGMIERHQIITGVGSGFFISPDGYAVTNNHVVDHAKSVQVTTDDGSTYTAKVIGTDPKTDLALIKVDGKSNLAYVKFEDQAPRVGDWVVAVGNPFGLGGTVTAGIISAEGRDIGSGPYDNYIQIDAPINKGNSGGPAFDMNGKVIGVNTAIYSPSGGSVGIGFDIPAQTAKMVVAQLRDKGKVTRGWLGVQVQPVTKGIADSLGLKKAEGAMVDELQSGSPAAKAGIQSGDIVTALNGNTIKDSRDLAQKGRDFRSRQLGKARHCSQGGIENDHGHPWRNAQPAASQRLQPGNAGERGLATSWADPGPANQVAGSGGQGRCRYGHRSGRPGRRTWRPDRRHHT